MKLSIQLFSSILLFMVCINNIHAQKKDTSIYVNQHFKKSWKNGPLISGHRGGFDSNLPENSLARFNMIANAFKKSAVMLELDIRQSADGDLFIMHDETIDRTTNGVGVIKELASTYLESLYLKAQKGDPTQERIPTFDGVLKWLSAHKNVYLMVDVKDDLWQKTVQKIKKKRLEDRCLILTFSPINTQKVYQLSSTITISTLISSEKDWERIKALNIPFRNLVAYINAQTPVSLIEKLKKNGIVLTSDISENVQKHPDAFDKGYYTEFLKTKQVDILITDYPFAVQELLK
ncbi:glycerophosphodiester phosphodiesterase family protein [Arcicella aquatica]|uniref:Glycerophosphodiester phosphodiesterase family protein n=1 Tax=Arcicella aquatica TaxID=217141 RepID=A0ABU5QSU0_9BACT|nr:glycerophosphodiester phosphodiesterase family protein [Arcicella aquatica]MEA5260175.1 glycerophosphodiester phosphodiesterase family protein [Arcicella aquatica]